MNELTLFQPPLRSWGSPNLSPFCAKLETYLRIAEVPYKPGKVDFRKSPKGKIPYVDLDGALVGDSQLIIEELERRLAAEGKQPLDDGLTAEDAALARMIRRTLEEGLYFVGLYVRWHDDAGYRLTRDEFKKFVPGLLIPIIRRMQNKKLHAQGTGRHTYDEVMAIGGADLDALATLLGDKPFMLGDRPRVIDCTTFAFLEALLGFPLETPFKTRGQAHANLAAFRQRIRDRWWPDLPATQTTQS